MRKNIPMTKEVYYLIVGLCSIIIMANSIEIIIRAKDIELFNLWLSNPKISSQTIGQSNQQIYSTYLTMCLSIFLIKVITPIGFAINSFFSFTKLGVNKLFVLIWIVLVIGLFCFTSLGQPLDSIFFMISALGNVILVWVLFYLLRQINKHSSVSIL